MRQHQWDSSHDPQTVPLFLALQWAQRRSMEGLEPRLGQHGLSLAEFDVLATLRNAPPPHVLTPSQLQGRMVITSGGLSKVLRNLEQRALLTRPAPAADRRVKPVQLTASGAALIEPLMAELVAFSAGWMKRALKPAQLGQLTELLGRLIDAD